MGGRGCCGCVNRTAKPVVRRNTDEWKEGHKKQIAKHAGVSEPTRGSTVLRCIAAAITSGCWWLVVGGWWLVVVGGWWLVVQTSSPPANRKRDHTQSIHAAPTSILLLICSEICTLNDVLTAYSSGKRTGDLDFRGHTSPDGKGMSPLLVHSVQSRDGLAFGIKNASTTPSTSDGVSIDSA